MFFKSYLVLYIIQRHISYNNVWNSAAVITLCIRFIIVHFWEYYR